MNLSVRTVLAFALPLALTGCFLMPGAGSGGGMGPQSPQGTPSSAGEPPPSEGSMAPSTPGSSNGGQSGAQGGAKSATPEQPKPVSMSIDMKNECPKTVHLFFGEKPGFSSGRSSTLGSNTLTSEGRGNDGTLTIWVTDDHEHGLASVKVAPSQRKATIGSDCTSIHAE